MSWLKLRKNVQKSVVVCGLVLISPIVMANWQQDFVGTPSFSLGDDPTLAEKRAIVKEIKAQLEQLERKVAVRKKAVEKAKADKQLAKKTVDALTKKIAAATATIKSEKAKVAQLKPQKMEAQKGLKLAKATEKLTAEDADKAAQKVNQLKAKIEQLSNTCQSVPAADGCHQQLKKMQQRLTKLEKKSNEKKAIHKLAVEALNKAQKQFDTIKTSLAAANKKITQQQETKKTLSANLVKHKTHLVELKKVLQTAQAELKPVLAKLDRVNEKKQSAVEERNQYRRRLVQRILEINKRGAHRGNQDGKQDGASYAEQLGVEIGQSDGDRDGSSEGRAEGMQREYNRGHEAGVRQGYIDGNEDGEKDGVREGTIAGNIAAATREGTIAGTKRAENSDAADVGTAQGRKDGLQRAIDEGKIAGFAIGKKQAIDKYESIGLEATEVGGKFVGAFTSQIPSYPGFNCGREQGSFHNSICPNFNPRQQITYRLRRSVVRRAYIDGYLARYKRARKHMFQEVIGDVYLTTYNETYRSSFSYFSQLEYPEKREQGFSNGHQEEYSRVYPLVKQDFFEKYKGIFANEPNRKAKEYKTTFARVEQSTFVRVYENIRQDFYQRVEQNTFASQIDVQTEKFRKIRFAAVSRIYQESPVLSFVSSSLFDGGISGVAKNDGIFQPGESIIQSVTLRNFGKVAAQGVKVTTVDGKQFTLPTIPAQSEVIVKGAAKVLVSSQHRVHTSKKLTLQIKAPLTAEKAIQGRHFCNAPSGQLVCSDIKRVKVEYPFQLDGLASFKQLLINQQEGMKIHVVNSSKRPFVGPLVVKLSVNSNSSIITRAFDTIPKLRHQVTLKSARVLVQDPSDIYTPLSFKATITKNGVVIGKLEQPLVTMVKAPFINQAGQSVIVVNSDQQASELIDMINRFGGVTNVGVLDSSLASLNQTTFNSGLKQKEVVVMHSGLNAMNLLLKTSVDSLFVTTDTASFNSAKELTTMRDAAVLPVVLGGLSKNQEMLFTNPYRASLKAMNMVTNISTRNLVNKLRYLSPLRFSDEQLVAQLQGIGREQFFKPNMVVKTVELKALGEIMMVSNAYLTSGRDDRYASVVANGQTMLFQKLLAHAGTKASRSKLGVQMMAITVNHLFRKLNSEFTPISDKIAFKISNRVKSRLSATMGSTLLWAKKKLLKTFKKMNKGLYKQLSKQVTVNAPFDLQTYFDEDSRADLDMNY